MFTDGRSKRVILLAHCLLNQNAISDGTAVCPAAFRDLIELLPDAQVGILQMPCPEFCCLGLDRGDPLGASRPVTVENTRIRTALEQPGPYAKLSALADQVVRQVLDYHRHGFAVLGIVGADRSPSCGVETTSDHGEEVSGTGLFLSALHDRLQTEGITLPMVGLKAGDSVAEKLRPLLSL